MGWIFSFGDKIKKIKQDGCVYVFAVNTDEKKLQEVQEQALVRLQPLVTLPGFRAGKVPMAMIKEQFPSTVKDEVLDILAKAAVTDIMKSENISPVVAPHIKNVRYETGKSVYFELQIECSPVLNIKNYDKLHVTRKKRNITDDDVSGYVARLREYNAYLEPVEENAVVGGSHFVIVNYETWENGAKLPDGDIKGEIVDMSSPQTISGLAGNILGAKKGETREFDSVAADKKLHFKVSVVEIKRKVVPEIDGEFLKEAGVKTVEELKTNVRKLLERGENEKTEKDVVSQIEEALISNNPLTLPPTLVKEETRELLEILKKRARPGEEIKEDDFLEKLRPVAERNLKLTYLLHGIAKKEKIEATETDLASELEKVAAGLPGEEEKKKARELFEKRRDYIMATIVENKTMDMIRSKAVIKEESK